MVTIIAFLSITNIALGYGLALYITRNYETPGKTVTETSRRLVEPESRVELADAPTRVDSTTDQIVAESPTSNQPAQTVELSAKAEGSETVDEENVLAGIEAFRSQLAQMSNSQDSSTEKSVEARELVGAAN